MKLPHTVLSFIAAVAGAFLIAALALAPPPARERGANHISPSGLMSDIRVIAKAPHTTGSIANAEVRAYLVGRLTQLGASVQQRPFPLPEGAQRILTRWKLPATEGVNIVGRIPGADRTQAPIVLMAHYDSVPGSPGAADDAAGVASILEIVRTLKGKTRRDLVVVFTDAEEVGLVGARAFFIGAMPIAGVVNLEARGGGGRAAMFETGRGQAALTQAFAREVERPTAHSFAMLVYKLLPNDTDFTPANKLGLPGFNFAFIGRPGLYHSPAATPDNIQLTSVQHMAEQAMAAVRVIDRTDPIMRGGEYPVFSDVFGLFLISHSAAFGWLPIAVSALALALAAAFATRRDDWRWKGLGIGLGAGLLLFPVSAAALFGMNLLSGGDGYYERLAATGWLELQAVLLCGAVLMVLPRRWMGLWGGWIGLMILGLILAVTLQLFAPQAAPLVAWPLTAVTLASLALARVRGKAWRVGALTLLVFAAAFVLYWAHLMFVGAGQDLPSAIALFLFLVAIALWPFLSGMPGRKGVAVVALMLLIGSAGVAMKVRLDGPSPMAATY